MSTPHPQPFCTRAGALYTPTEMARGFWAPGSLHARVVIGLLAREIERNHGGPDFVPARLTVDLYRMPADEPAEVVTRALRTSHRLRVVDAEYLVGGVSLARASCQLLRRSQEPEGDIWRTPNWDAPAPDALASEDGPSGMWEFRPLPAPEPGARSKRTWLREIRQLVEGEALTPFERCALAADFASPFSNATGAGLGFINSDVSLHLHRLPAGEWIGFEVVDHQSTDGVSTGACLLYDIEGPIGSCAVTALAQPRPNFAR